MSIYKPGRPSKYTPSAGDGRRPPSLPGEYRIRDGSNRIAYVGETNNLNRRMHEHIRSGKLSEGGGVSFEWKVADGRSTSRTRRIHEQAKIKQHCPDWNKSVGGEGRPAGK